MGKRAEVRVSLVGRIVDVQEEGVHMVEERLKD